MKGNRPWNALFLWFYDRIKANVSRRLERERFLLWVEEVEENNVISISFHAFAQFGITRDVNTLKLMMIDNNITKKRRCIDEVMLCAFILWRTYEIMQFIYEITEFFRSFYSQINVPNRNTRWMIAKNDENWFSILFYYARLTQKASHRPRNK